MPPLTCGGAAVAVRVGRATAERGSALEKRPAPPVRLVPYPGRAREDGRRRVPDVLVHRVRPQIALHLDEPRLRVALVGDEEQPGVEPAQAIGAVDEAV